MSSKFTLSAVPALLAVLSITATPAAAAELPVAATSHVSVDVAPAWSPGEDTAANYRRYRHRRNRVDIGDVITGVLIIGGIAAIANAATRHRDYRYRDRNGDWRNRGGNYPDSRYPGRYPDSRYPDGRDYRGGNYGDYGNGGEESRGLDRAVDQCVAEIERNERVQRVQSVERDGNGWRVNGSLYNGEAFSCSIGEDGRIENLDTGGQGEPYRSGDAEPYGDRQWGDDRYGEERARIEGHSGDDMAEAPEADYPESEEMGESDNGEPVDGDLEVGTGYPGAD